MPARRRVRATLGYRGTHYAGWGIQPHQPSVQASVESALASALGHPVRVTAAGRTDAGVHADAQVISFDTSSAITPAGLRGVLPRYLPDDIWFSDVAEAPADFDARKSAHRRWYRYALWRHGTPPAAWQGRCLSHDDSLDLPAMRAASRHLIGRQDFASLVTRPAEPGSTHRTVFAADWLEISPALLVFEVCADAFLKQMVRTIVGSLLWVGAQRWQPADFAAALTAADRRAAGPNAPAVGLSLHRIEY
jgi:tRNA pseudouridine38-40 synthase